MSKNLSAKYYQVNNERLPKNAGKRYQNLSKEEKEKKKQYGPLNVAKVSQKMKMKSLVSIEKML